MLFFVNVVGDELHGAVGKLKIFMGEEGDAEPFGGLYFANIESDMVFGPDGVTIYCIEVKAGTDDHLNRDAVVIGRSEQITKIIIKL